jgi:hypothetical protein
MAPGKRRGGRDAFDGNVGARALDGCFRGEHFALAGSFQVAVDLLIDRHSAQRRAFAGVTGGKRSQLHVVPVERVVMGASFF